MTARIVDEAESDLARRARRVLPAAGFGNVTFDIIIREGTGGRVRDESGNEYIDFLLGSGPMILGHSHPDVTAAVLEQVGKGSTFFANNEAGIRLAEEIVEASPCAEKVRFLSSGSEATFYAMRLARAKSQRSKIMKFEGGFHGMSDYALMSMAPRRPGNFPQAASDTAGIPDAISNEMLIAPFNNTETAISLIREHQDELAAVIVEPLQRMIPPEPGFLVALREVTLECGIALIFDEVVTGFRFAYGGAQEFYGVTPDLCALGKIIGGGYPLSAVAGKNQFMKYFDAAEVGIDYVVKQIGTLSGNPIASVAGLATLNVLKGPSIYDRLFQTGQQFMDGLTDLFAKHRIAAQVRGVPPMFDILFTNARVIDYRSAAKSDSAKLKIFNEHVLKGGLLKGDNKFYVSTAHSKEDIAQAIEICDKALAAVAAV